MKYLKIAAIPALFIFVAIVLPRVIADLLNSHTNIGLVVISLLACLVFGVIAYVVNKFKLFEKED